MYQKNEALINYMARYQVNTVIDNRYLLTESLSYDSHSGRQVWAATDTQTQKRLVGRFEPNGRVEWFEDNRPGVGSGLPKPLPQATATIAARVPFRVDKSRLRPFLPVLFLLGALLIVVGYQNRESLKEILSVPEESTPTHRMPVTASDVAKPENEERESGMQSRIEVPKQPSVRFEWQEAAGNLDQMDEVLPSDRKAVFDQAIKSFSVLRQSGTNMHVLDSLSKIYTSRGARSLSAFQKTGQSSSKRDAVDWYNTAFSLTPTNELRQRIGSIVSLKSRYEVNKKPPRKKVREQPMFEKDPEIN